MSELECLAYGVGADEGVCLLLKLGRYRVLLDCGLTDLSTLLATKASPPADLVLCSHAHADHARGLLALHQAFPQLPIYASEVTTQFLPLNWPTVNPNGSYEKADPGHSISLCHALPWRTSIEFFDGLNVELYPSGHLPGATSFLLTYTPLPEDDRSPRAYTVLYTGDFFLSNARLVEGMPLEELRGLEPDVLIVEGSYGTARHPHRRQQENQLAERIARAIADKQSILLPAPALGLGQELLMLLRSHHHFTGRDIDIWVDGSVAAGCDAYLEILPHLPTSVQNFARHQALFWDERVRPRVRHLNASRQVLLAQRPSIVLTDVTADLSQYYADNPGAWLVLQPQEPHYGRDQARDGGQGAGEKPARPTSTDTESRDRGRNIPATTQPSSIFLHPLPHTETYLLAQHCDGPGTTQLIHNLRPQHVVFVHGSPTYLADLTGLEELHNRYHLHTPAANSLVELPIGETFLHAAAPEASYEGELTELNMSVTITLPDAITVDPRWQQLADTGLIEARWQGDELVLRGLPQRELLRPNDRLLDWMDANSPLRNCCGNCRHYRSQRCWNQLSPLFEFKVTPDGFCPVFEPIQTPEERT
ncbi:MAG: MBL fold metallo-hydrolase [Stenomitos rutilans HA7619-LM2]|nr:MBL fold metallo-hydrolase [Stenomitos rutilans HA7619-LM2]